MTRVRITDHAIVRYLERAGGFEIEKLRKEMAQRVLPSALAGCSAAYLDGYVFILRPDDQGGIAVTTVLEPSQAPKNSKVAR